ncbi:MAG: hypothetical protein K9N06_02380 [Candidatus Cloacimonetes bacterium]|nr:hypothetical protein [Candidatus Cloacimonadota bacterium]
MIASSFLSLIIYFVIFFFIAYFINRKSKVPFLVMTKYDLDESLEGETIIHLVGRRAGFFSWIMHKLNISNRYELILKQDELNFEERSMFGEEIISIPLDSISETRTGHTKPLLLIFLAIIFFISGLLLAGSYTVILFVLGVIFVIVYFFGKALSISVRTRGGSVIGIKFKPSFIEGISVDINRAIRTTEIIREVVRKRS